MHIMFMTHQDAFFLKDGCQSLPESCIFGCKDPLAKRSRLSSDWLELNLESDFNDI